jgi:TolB-like protein/Flp pilus assembly protein TadD
VESVSFFAELKRRNVVRVGIAYVVASWLLLQLTEVLTELLELGPEVGKIVIVLLIVGFVPALIFAWAFELTPEGIRRESEVDRSESITPDTGKRLNALIMIMLAVTAGYFIWESRFRSAPAPESAPVVAEAEPAEPAPDAPAEAPEQEKSIVVLPFVNMSADPEQEFFSDGLSEEILNALVPIEDLRVISRTSAFAFKGKDLAIPEIAEQLGVSHVLEGSVRSSGDDLRITAQLIEVATDSHLWSQAYSRKLENVFEVQLEISEAIAEQLELQLSEREQTGSGTDNLDAYTLYLRGRHHYQTRGPEEMALAEDLLSQAVDLDPEYDQAWANLAAAQTIRAYYQPEAYQEHLANASASANRALGINPKNGFAYAVLGLLAHGRFEFQEAVNQLELAIELSPNESNAYLWKAITLSALGFNQEATDTLQQAVRFDPAFANLHNWLITLALNEGDLEAARSHLDAVEALGIPDVNDPGELALLSGDFEGFKNAINSTPTPIPDDVKAAWITVGAARLDPARTPEAVRAVLDNQRMMAEFNGWVFLLRLGALDAAVEAWGVMRDHGNDLMAVNNLSSVWTPETRAYLEQPQITRLFEEVGLMDYWRTHGDPDFCRVVGEGLECTTE